MSASRDLNVRLSVRDDFGPAIWRQLVEAAITNDYVGSALAHEGIEPDDPTVARIAGDLRARLIQFGPRPEDRT